MFISKKHLPRRTFLKGAGFTLGLPLLDAMVPAATAWANTNKVKRAGWIYFPHGAIAGNTAHGPGLDFWNPRTTGRDFEFSPILASLAPFRDHVTVVSGLNNSPAATGQVHNTHVGTWLSANKPLPTPATNHAPSVDQIAARFIGQQTPLPSLQVAATNPGSGGAGPFGSSYSGNMSFPTANSFLRPIGNLTQAFQRVFGAGGTEAIRNSLRQEQTSMLDLFGSSAQQLLRTLGPADAMVMNNYLEQVRELERRAAVLDSKDLTEFGISNPPSNPSAYNDRFDAMFDLIILAFRADMTRIFTYLADNEGGGAGANSGVVFPTGQWHSTSHHADQMHYIEPLVQIQTWYTNRFSLFVQKLAETQDGDGSLLDSSMIIWGSNMGNSHKHDNQLLPNVLVGRGGGSIRGGQHLRYTGEGENILANLWLTMLDRLDVPLAAIDNKIGNSRMVFSEV